MSIPEPNFPTKGDRLFRSDLPDYQHNAVIMRFGGNLGMWYRYVDGYREAADMLAVHIVELPYLSDSWLYPLAFLYRQHVELALKTIIIIGSRYTETAPPDYHHHRLADLWPHGRRYISTFWPEEDSASLDAVEAIIKEWASVDPYSDGFRYPFAKRGQESLPLTLTHVNVRHFAETASKLSSFLSVCLTGMDVELDQKYEFMAEMRQNIDAGYWM